MPRKCASCDKVDEGHTMKKCGLCESVYYCNKICQRQHWSQHKPHCANNIVSKCVMNAIEQLRTTLYDDFIAHKRRGDTYIVATFDADGTFESISDIDREALKHANPGQYKTLVKTMDETHQGVILAIKYKENMHLNVASIVK